MWASLERVESGRGFCAAGRQTDELPQSGADFICLPMFWDRTTFSSGQKKQNIEFLVQ